MGFLDRALELRSWRVGSSNPQSPAWWLIQAFGGQPTSSGVRVTAETALNEATVFSACRNLAEDLASIPLPVYRGNPQGNRQADIDYADPAWNVLNRRANPEMTAMSLRETLHGHIALRGDGYAEIERDETMRVRALWPLRPDHMRMERNGQNGLNVAGSAAGKLFYLYTLPSGQVQVFDRSLIFHPRGFGPDGLRGYSLVALLAETIGLALATERYGGRFFANDARPGAVLEHPKELSDKARLNIETSWQETHEGLDNAHRIAILEEGMTLKDVGIPPVDAQFLETRKLQRDLLAMALRMPPDKLGNYERATYANLEQSDIAYVRYTLTPRGTRFEQQLAADGVVDANHTAVHDYIGLLKGDALTRATYYHSLRQDGAISGEDIRRMENFGPSGQPAADELLVALNMMPASAFRPNGLTLAQTATAAYEMLRAGYEASAVNDFLGLGDLAHTGVVPGKTTPVASEETNGGGPADPGSAAGRSSEFLGDEVGQQLLALLNARKNGQHPITEGSR